MEKVLVYPIKSMLHNKDVIDNNSKELLDELNKLGDYEFDIISDVNLLNNKSLILVQSGGSENKFLKDVYPYFKGPYYLLTYGANNSLAASLEIISFLNQKNEKAEVLHGDINYINNRLNYLFNLKENKGAKLGVFGKPSDWLISSDVEANLAKKIFNIDLINFSNEEIEKHVLSYINNEYKYDFKKMFDKTTLIKSYAIYEALLDLSKKNNLDGFTIRCFDVLMITKQSACFALAKLNENGIIASCEGDVPAMITAYIVKKLFDKPAFQVNPQFVYPTDKIVTFAHCTIPLNMAKDYEFMTHYESGMGLGIKADIYEGDCTVFKISSNLKEFYVDEGYLTQDDFSLKRCRTQVRVKFDNDVTYFLRSSLGNHHQIIYGRCKKEIIDYLTSLGLKHII